VMAARPGSVEPGGVPRRCRAHDRQANPRSSTSARRRVSLPARHARTAAQGIRLMTSCSDRQTPACRIDTAAGPRRLVVAARQDPETGETYGVTTHLRPCEASTSGG
jgi:hypothetical protein